MKSLELYLAGELIAEEILKKVTKTEIKNEGDEIWLYFEVTERKRGKLKEGEDREVVKPYKYDLAKNWGLLKDMYETYVSTDLLRQGYMLIPLEGSWLVVGGEEPYQLEAEACTCLDFNTRLSRASRCKHLIFRDWHTRYRARCQQARKLFE